MRKIYWVCLIIILVIYGFDCLILTPYALDNYQVEEIGLFASFFYHHLGIAGLGINFGLASISLFFIIKGLNYLEKNYKDACLLSLLVVTCLFSGLMLYTILNNLHQIGFL